MGEWLEYAYLHAVAFAAFGSLIASMGAFYASIRNGGKINTVQVRIDGRMEELLSITKEAAKAEGKEAGRDQEMLRRAEAVAVVKATEVAANNVEPKLP